DLDGGLVEADGGAARTDLGRLQHAVEPDRLPCADRHAVEVRADRAALQAVGQRGRGGWRRRGRRGGGRGARRRGRGGRRGGGRRRRRGRRRDSGGRGGWRR